MRNLSFRVDEQAGVTNNLTAILRLRGVSLSLSLSPSTMRRGSPCEENHSVWQAQHTGSHHGGHIVEGRIPPLGITIPGDWQPVINALCSRMSILLHMLLHRITHPQFNQSDKCNLPIAKHLSATSHPKFKVSQYSLRVCCSNCITGSSSVLHLKHIAS